MRRSDNPPSSRRHREPLGVTIRSAAMQALSSSVLKACRRRRYVRLIVRPGDTAEIISFAEFVTRQLAVSAPQVVQPQETTLLRPTELRTSYDDSSSLREPLTSRPVVFLKTDALQPGLLEEFLDGHDQKRHPWPMVLAVWSSTEDLLKSYATWPEAMRRMFVENPLTWPELGRRRDDLAGIADEICVTLNETRQGTIVVADEAKRTLRSFGWPTVSAMRDHLLEAKSVAQMMKSNRIMGVHLEAAALRRRRLSNPPVTSPTDNLNH